MKLISNAIHLIKVDDRHTLFLHADSLQIYPLQEGDEVLKFLRALQQQGEDNTRSLYGETQYEEMYNFVCEKITTAPTPEQHLHNTSNISYTQVILPIAGHCNLNCPYCFAQTDGGFHFRDYKQQDIINVLEFLVKKNPNEEIPITLIFFGGEPLLRLDIIKFTIQYIKTHYPNRDFHYSITTNGTIINDEIIQLFKDNNMAVLLSLDGPDNEFNLRKYKNGEKSIENVLRNVQLLKDSGVPVELRATLINTNPYILETFQFFEDLQVKFHIVFAYSSENTSHHYATYDTDTIERIKAQLDRVVDYYIAKANNREDIYNKMFKNCVSKIRYRTIENVLCGAGWSFFTITADGTIFPCAHFMNNPQYSIGNIFDEQLNEGKRAMYTPAYIEELYGCDGCWAKRLCLGGCMAQKATIGRTSNMTLGEEECQLKRLVWEFYIKLYYHFMTIAPSYFIKSSKQESTEC